MAQFTPGDVEVNYKEVPTGVGFNVAPQAIKQPEAPRSKEFLFQGAGQLLEGAGKLVNEANDQIVTDSVHAIDDKRKAEEISRRTQLLTQVGAATGAATGEATATLGADADKVLTTAAMSPQTNAQINATVADAKMFANAQASGKMSTTEEKARRDLDVKKLRDRLPWLRDKIDAKYESITGEKSANAFIHSMTEDINSYITQAREQRNKDETFIRENFGKIPNADRLLIGIREGTLKPADMYHEVLPILARDAALKSKAAEREDRAGDWKEIQSNDEREMHEKIAHENAATLSMLHFASRKYGNISVQDWRDKIAKEGRADPNDVATVTSLVQNAQEQTDARITKWLSEERTDSTGAKMPSRYSVLGDKVGPALALGAQPTKEYVKAIAGGNPDIASAVEKINKAMAAGDLNTLYEDPRIDANTRMWIRTLAALNHAGGPEFVGKIVREAAGIPDTQMAKFLTSLSRIFTNDGNPDPKAPPSTTPGDQDDKLRASGATPSIRSKLAVSTVTKMADPNTPLEYLVSGAKSMFGDKNANYLNPSRFERDTIDPDTKEPKVGRFWLFKNLTSEGMINNMKRVAVEHPEIAEAYTKWIDNEFYSNLFSREIATLVQTQGNSDISIDWNFKEGGFTVHSKKEPAAAPGLGTDPFAPTAISQRKATRGWREARADVEANQLRDILEDKMNPAIQGVMRVYKEAGLDPNEKILDMFREYGLDVSNFSDQSNPAVKAARAMMAKRASDLMEQRAREEKMRQEKSER